MCEYKELDDCGSCKNSYMWNPSTRDCKCNETYKIDEYLDIKNCWCEKPLFGNLALVFEDEILNTIEASLDNKKVICEEIIDLFTLFHRQLYA